MPIINSVLAGSSGGGDTVTVEAIGAAKNAQVGDKVLLNTSLANGTAFDFTNLGVIRFADYDNYVYTSGGTYLLNQTGTTKINDTPKGAYDFMGFLGNCGWNSFGDIFSNGVEYSFGVAARSLNRALGFACKKSTEIVAHFTGDNTWETWTCAGSTSSYCGFLIIDGKAFGNTLSAGGVTYKGTLNYSAKTITFENTSGHGTMPGMRNGGEACVCSDQSYVVFDRDINQIYNYNKETEVFSLVSTPDIIKNTATGTINSVYVNKDGDLVVCSGQVINTYSWEPGDISTCVLKDSFTNPLETAMTAICDTPEFYIFDKAVFAKGTSTEQVAEIYNGHNFNNTTLTGVVSKVNNDNTVEVKTVLPEK